MHKHGISVIICCYNSASRLPETIKHLGLQILPEGFLWEVILVNNASKDHTENVALLEFEKQKGLTGKFRIIREPKAGLSFARHTGAIKAVYNYLVFCDDDNWLDPYYLINAYHIMENNQKIGALGGRSTAGTDDIKFPDWFESLQNGFAVGPQSPYEGDVSKTCTLWGAGLITRTRLYLRFFTSEYPSIMTGRKGDELSSGEDTELCMRLLLKGYKLYYDERLTFIHFIPKERLKNRERTVVAPKHIMQMTLEMNNYSLLYKLINKGSIGKPLLILKTFSGYISTFIGRKSWSIMDVKIILYFYTLLDLGVTDNTKMVYHFYKNYSLPSD